MGDIPYKKFMFDTDFDELAEQRTRAKAAAQAADTDEEDNPEPEPEPEVPTFSEDDLNRAREEGHAEGLRVGTEQAASTVEKQIADALNTIVQRAQVLFDTQAAANQDVTHHAISVAAALVRKLFPTLNQQTAQDQVQDMLETALGQLTGETEIIVRVPADLAENLHGRITEVSELSGFRGNIKVLGDPALTTGDCQLEWSSGGVKRSAKELAKQLDDIVARNLNAAAQADAAADDDDIPDDEPAEAEAPEPAAVQPTETTPAAEEGPEAAALGTEPTPAPMPEPEPEAAMGDHVTPATVTPDIVAETNAQPEPPAEPAPEPEPVPEPSDIPAAEDTTAGPPPVPSAEFIAEADVAPHHPPLDEAAGPAPVPSEDLVAEPALAQESEPVNEQNDEASAAEPPKYGGADLELIDDLKD